MLSHDLDLSSAVIRSERGAVASRLILSCLMLSHCDELGFPGVPISGPYACVHLNSLSESRNHLVFLAVRSRFEPGG